MPHKRKELNISGATLWYVVGLITSDGSLSCDGRHINITAKDGGFLANLKASMGITNRIGVKNKDKINEACYIEFSNKNFYEFLLSIGLTPCKSLTQDEVIVEDNFFGDFLRGVIDGDGCIRRWIHPGNNKEQWSLRIYSPSIKFLEWLQGETEQLLRARGRIHKEEKERPMVDMYVLTYGKLAAQAIFSKCYYEKALSLERKAKLARACCLSDTRWKKSRTVLAFN
jgi:hypothetical protein